MLQGLRRTGPHPSLKPDDVVVLDDLGSHRGKAVRKAIRQPAPTSTSCPPYSPDLNPIEQVFAKLKTPLRKAGERSIDALWRRMGALFDLVSPSGRDNDPVNAGYASA